MFWQVKWFLFREQCSVISKYYRNFRFVLVDLMYGFVNLFWNPYRACRKFLQKKGETDVYVYGETPLTTFETLMCAVQLGPSDRYVELGSGRGKTCLWAALFSGCEVRGVEWVSSFVKLSRWINRVAGTSAQFEQRSIFDVDLSAATVVYFYGIHLDIQVLEKVFARMPVSSHLITVGEPVGGTLFEVVSVLKARFPWGSTEAYVQKKCIK